MMKKDYYKILVPLTVSIIVTAIYCIVRIVLFFAADYPWTDKIFAFFLLWAEIFILLHGIGYIINILYIVKEYKGLEAPPTSSNLESYPPVAVVVASYKEPIDVIRDTLLCCHNLSYPNKHVYLLDDTRYDQPWAAPEVIQKYKKDVEDLCQELEVNVFRHPWHDAKAGMLNDFLDYVSRKEGAKYDLISYDKKEKKEPEKYLIVFDADMNPFPHFVEPLLAKMESDSRLAFIQTPQYYTNFLTNRVAKASGLMQAVFYEFICEAKGMKNSMFCCGTNVIYRIEALIDVGGFDHLSVTEDFATSFSLHSKKWKSDYLNNVTAFGMGPEDLGAFFKQQYRWSFGTIGLLRQTLAKFLRSPFLFTLNMWWQYFLSSTYYLIGWVFLIMLVSPMAYIFFDVPSYFANPMVYFICFVPYLILSNLVFYWTLSFKKYRFIDLIKGVLLISITFPVYMRSAFLALIGKNTKFVVTPKGQSNRLPLTELWPQLLAALLSLAAVIWGLLRIYFEQDLAFGIAMNAVWCLYYFLILSSVIYFNNPVDEQGA